MVDAELLRKALLEQLQFLRESGVTHLPPVDWNNLLAAIGSPDRKLGSQLQSEAARAEARTETKGETRAEGGDARSPARSGERRPESRPPQAAAMSREAGSGAREAGASVADQTPYGPRLAPADQPTALQVIRAEVEACRCCPELVRNRRQTVFGVGSPQARLCFLGEAPGQEEDARGEPFVGAAGQLLDKIIAACKLQREEVFILNTVKCRPPMNRTPSDGEVQNCWQFAHRQLEIIQPEFICCLGSVAAKSLLQTGKSIGQLRGMFHRYRGSRVVVTYHPAYLLRTPSAKRHVWDDMKMLMRELGVEL